VPTAQHTHVGAIAGGVNRGILGLALILGGLGYLFWRSNRKKKVQAELSGVPAGRVKNELDDTHCNELETSLMLQQHSRAMPNRSLNAGSPVELGPGPARRKGTVTNDSRNIQSTSSEHTEVPADSSYR